MAINTAAPFTRQGDFSADSGTAMSGTLTTAAADYTGISANHALVHTAGADGSFVRAVVLKALGTNVASVARVYINNGSAQTTATNNVFVDEITLPATTATNAAATTPIVLPLNVQLQAGWRIYVGLGTTVAAGWRPSVIAGQY